MFVICIFTLVFTYYSLHPVVYANEDCTGQIICYLNRKAFHRKEGSRVTLGNLKQGIHQCSYLIYGYIGFGKGGENYTLELENFDKREFKSVLTLKELHPELKVLVCIGGYADETDLAKYLDLLEKPVFIRKFIRQIRCIAHLASDGIDLAWRFPTIDTEQEKSILGYNWDVAGTENYQTVQDDRKALHKSKFTDFCEQIFFALKKYNKIFTISVLPRIRQQDYYDPKSLAHTIKHVHLMTFDYKTPITNPHKAGYSDPITYPRNYGDDYTAGKAIVGWWLNNRMPGSKVYIGLPAFGRTWVLADDNILPPINAIGPGDAGDYFRIKGTMAYYELCKKIVLNSEELTNSTYLRQFNENKALGSFAYSHLQSDHHDGSHTGTWISYPDPDYASVKARYSRLMGLGGVAIVDISLDDFSNKCGQGYFPLLTATKLYI